VLSRPDDPRLGEVMETWDGAVSALRPGRAVLIGFPQDEGVRRNHGRPGAAEAPHEIRRWLRRLTPWDGETEADLAAEPPLDLGDVRISGSLEVSQQALGEVIAAVLQSGAIPIVLGGGHETAYGHYLGYVFAGMPVGIVNVDAHLDVRPCVDGRGHSGTPFRQALEHPTHPLPGRRYACVGAEPSAVSREHLRYVEERGGQVTWYVARQRTLIWPALDHEIDRLAADAERVYVTIDADIVRQADVPGVSAPHPAGVDGSQPLACARVAGQSPHVSGIDLVEINPRFDRDGQSARWGALLVWNFLVGLTCRRR
jgi:formiminoglutamase